MYNNKGLQEITGLNWMKLNALLDAFRITPEKPRLYSYDQIRYILQCYDLKKESGLTYPFIKKMPMRLIKDLIRMNEDPDKDLRRKQKKEYDKQRYLKKTL